MPSYTCLLYNDHNVNKAFHYSLQPLCSTAYVTKKQYRTRTGACNHPPYGYEAMSETSSYYAVTVPGDHARVKCYVVNGVG